VHARWAAGAGVVGVDGTCRRVTGMMLQGVELAGNRGVVPAMDAPCRKRKKIREP